MDDRLKKNPKNELLEDIRKIVKEEIEKVYIPYPPLNIHPEPWQPLQLNYWDRWDNHTTVHVTFS